MSNSSNHNGYPLTIGQYHEHKLIYRQVVTMYVHEQTFRVFELEHKGDLLDSNGRVGRYRLTE